MLWSVDIGRRPFNRGAARRLLELGVPEGVQAVSGVSGGR